VEKRGPEDARAALSVFESSAQAQEWPEHVINREVRRVRDVIETVRIDIARRIAFMLAQEGRSLGDYEASAVVPV
jgi:hypothetical protein